jgi:PAS domain S-box-containing protein
MMGPERRSAGGVDLPDAEGLYQLLVESVQDYAIFMLDPTGRVTTWNVGARRLKGYLPEEIIGRHFSTFYPASDVAAGKPRRALEVATTEGRYEEVGWRVRKDGTLFWANVVITALRDPDGGLVGFAKVTRDLSERRRAEERALADARRVAAAEAANRAKTEFLAAMSHELRTPLNAIAGYAELLQLGIRGPVTDAQQADLARIRRSQQLLSGIINDILNFSRIEGGHLTYELGAVPLADVARETLPMIQPQAAARGITVVHGALEPRAVARADRAKVEQIAFNLLSNAVKFTPAGGRITVACAVREECAMLIVADSGPGVPADQREAVFEPFVQLGRTHTSGHAGTGLGLSISRQLARAMGGDIRYEETPGGGATFTVELPVEPPPEAPPE